MLRSIPYTCAAEIISYSRFRTSHVFAAYREDVLQYNPGMEDAPDHEVREAFIDWMKSREISFRFIV